MKLSSLRMMLKRFKVIVQSSKINLWIVINFTTVISHYRLHFILGVQKAKIN